ncbi:MAG: ribosome-associated translation inhibitor RaiA, partial [Clostridia bacterium]
MKIDISTKDYVMKDKLNDLILKKVGKLEKYFNKEVTAKVVCSERKGLYKMEITIISAGQYVRSEIESDNMYANLDTALSKIERQVIKYSDKLVAKRRKDVVEGSMFFDDEPV